MIVDFPASDPENAHVGARLRRWRLERGASLDDLAEATGLSPADLRLIEAGRARLDSAAMSAATRFLRLPLWALASDTPGH